MKRKLLFYKVVFICVFIFFLIANNFFKMEEHYHYSNLDSYEDFYNAVDFTYKDLDLTQEEKMALEKIRENNVSFLVLLNNKYNYNKVENTGIDYLNIQALEKVYDIKFDVKEGLYNPSDSYHNFLNGEFDFSSGLSKTKKRSESLIFSAPYASESVVLVTKSYVNVEDLDSLDGESVYVHEGSYFKQLLTDNTIISNIYEVNANDARSSFRDDDGFIEYFVTSLSVAMDEFMNLDCNIILLNEFLPIPPISVAASKNKENSLLYEHLLSAFSKAYYFGLNEIIEQYNHFLFNEFEIELLMKKLSDKEFKYLSEKKKINVAFMENKPYIFINGNKKMDGLLVDLLDDFGESVNLEIEYITGLNSCSNLIQTFQNKDVDLVLSSGCNFENENSQEFYNDIQVLINKMGTRAITSEYDLPLERIGLIEDYTSTDRIIDELSLSGSEVILFDNYEKLITAINKGIIDFAMVPNLTYDYYYAVEGMTFIEEQLTLGSKYNNSSNVVFDDDEEGITLFNILSKYKNSSDLDHIYHNWGTINTDYSNIIELKNRNIYLSILLFSTLALYMGHMIFNLYRKSYRSDLSSLRNRRSLYNRFKNKNIVNTSCIYIDLDNFKTVNDTFGHRAGDYVIKEISRRLNTNFQNFKVFHMGGDEFVIIIDKYSNKYLSSIDNLTRSIKNVINEPIININNNNEEYSVTASIGFASSNDLQVSDISELIHFADIAMYYAKYSKSHYVVASLEIINQYKKLINSFYKKNDN